MPEVIRVEQVQGRFIARCSFAQKDIVKAAGFRWDPNYREWWTKDPETAARIADPERAAKMAAEVQERNEKQAESIEQSRAADADVDLPCPTGLAYLGYQKAGIAYALKHQNTLFGDDMGLGKTIQAIGVINADPSLKKILVVCPASLKINWKRELIKWLTRKFVIGIGESQFRFYGVDILIVNYDLLDRNRERLHAAQWDCVIVDEAHYLKNPKAKRTQAIFGRPVKKARMGEPEVPALPELPSRRRLALTGTPIPNRISEGFGLFHWMDALQFKTFYGFSARYCAGSMGAYGYDATGASNLPELQAKLRGSFMVRRLKGDVLKELPAKRRCVIELPANGAEAQLAAEKTAWELHEQHMAELRAAVELAKVSDDPEDYKTAILNLKAAANVAFTEMSKVRHDTAVSKIPQVIEHVRNCLDSGGKIVLFVHHHDVANAIMEEFNEPDKLDRSNRNDKGKLDNHRATREDQTNTLDVPLQMRNSSERNGLHAEQWIIDGMPQVSSKETRHGGEQDIHSVDELQGSRYEAGATIRPKVGGYPSSGSLPAAGDSDSFRQSEVQRKQPIGGSNHPEPGVHQAEHLGDKLEGQRDQAQRHIGGTRSNRTWSTTQTGIAVCLMGGMADVDKQAAVDKFQRDDRCRLFVGGILAAGVGLTLTASSHVIFAELDWVPGNVTQAEDRCHRIGQHDSVLVEHLVLEESLDARMAATLVAKQEIMDQALDRKAEEIAVPVADTQRAASEGVSREQIAKEAAKVTRQQIEAAMRGLQMLVAMDGDKARELNGIGFSQADVYIGHSLAQRPWLTSKQAVLAIKLVNKYRRQLPEELVAAAKGEA